MAIFQNGVWGCGFDFLPNGAPTAGAPFDLVNGSPSINTTNARFTGKGMQTNGNNLWVARSYNTTLATVITGFAFNLAALPGSNLGIMTFYDTTAGALQCTLAVTSTGALGFYSVGGLNNNGTPSSLIAGSSAGVVIPNSYMYIEALVKIDATTGSLQCNANGINVISFSGNTKTTANASTGRIYMGLAGSSGSGGNAKFDDWYMLDTTGASPLDTFLGPLRVQTDGPNADSATGGLNAWSFTTPQGTDYGNCANIPATTAQYCSDATVSDRMSLKFPSINATTVFFLNTWFSAEQDAAGTRGITPIYRNGGTDQTGTAISLGTTYTYYNQASTTDPNGGATWASGSVSNAAGCEIGLEVTT